MPPTQPNQVVEQTAPFEDADFQHRVGTWMLKCFGERIANDQFERCHRFIEEALELVQACGTTQSECHQLVDYVFNRPMGERDQEIGGVMVTLAALCRAVGHNMFACGENELVRIWKKIDKIREKQANKPKHSPLPMDSPTQPNPMPTAEQLAERFNRLWIEEFGSLPQTKAEMDEPSTYAIAMDFYKRGLEDALAKMPEWWLKVYNAAVDPFREFHDPMNRKYTAEDVVKGINTAAAYKDDEAHKVRIDLTSQEDFS